ncbi:LysR family transcriptional regulator [Sporomusa termitida]|uniref:Hca operon transcriptional activator HcaR n=1 Tax=Sporomusa termitida TaxID=2377 RepID=A0A517E1K7_9FIRM|nr:LysR family transcriptional regulator [Sporomusa termitida]QDR83485.1 Hca operon transcriptional activator HcaR [Sporomusa termitida]
MDIRLMKEFICLAEQLNFSKAASRLYVSQSVLSRHIANLEKILGVQLFIRDTQSVQLTAAGEFVRDEFAAVVAKYDEAIRKINQMLSGIVGELRVGFLERAVKIFLPDLITQFRSMYPNVSLQLDQYNMGALAQALKREEIDIAFSLLFDQPEKGYSSKTLYRDSLAIVLPKNHPFAGKKVISLADLAHEPFIFAGKGESPGMFKRVIELCMANGFSPNIIKQYSFPENALLMVKTGLGIAILSRHMESTDSDLWFGSIEGDNTKIDVVITWKTANTNPAIQLFLKLLDSITF